MTQVTFKVNDRMKEIARKEAGVAAVGCPVPICDVPTDIKFALFIIASCANKHGVDMDDLLSPSRVEFLVRPRMLCFHLIRKFTHLTLHQIGVLVGNRDHGTVMYGVQALQDRREVDEEFSVAIGDWEKFALEHKQRFYKQSQKKEKA